MSDEIDRANDQQQTILDAHIATIRKHKLEIGGDGFCISCGHEVEPVLICGKVIVGRFCCLECRDIWAKENE